MVTRGARWRRWGKLKSTRTGQYMNRNTICHVMYARDGWVYEVQMALEVGRIEYSSVRTVVSPVDW